MFAYLQLLRSSSGGFDQVLYILLQKMILKISKSIFKSRNLYFMFIVIVHLYRKFM